MVRLYNCVLRTPVAVVDWQEVDPTTQALQYLHIAGPHDLTMVNNTNFGEKKFWSSIEFNENKLTDRVD